MKLAPLRPICCVLAALATPLSSAAAQQSVRSFAEPSLSPDGSEIAFASGGDIWVVPSAGGDAHLLVSHGAEESRPLWSPNGRRLAFLSNRAGDPDIYVLDLDSGVARRLTFTDANEELTAWSTDGAWIYFSSNSQDVLGATDVLRVRADGGTPMPVAADAYSEEFSAAPSPDGEWLVVAGRGRMPLGQWWRNGHSHIDESELWLVRPGGDQPTYTRLTAGGKNLWPKWVDDGQAVVFMSDRSGSENLWRVDVGRGGPSGPARQLTTFVDGRVLFPSVSADGRKVAFERDFGLWLLDTTDGEPRRVEIHLRGTVQTASLEHLSLTSSFSELALSPDGRKVAFVARGEVFAASAEDGGTAARVTRTVEAERGLSWASDSRRVAYSSRRDGGHSIWIHDFGTGEERRVSRGSEDVGPIFSPDGTSLAYIRNGTDLRVVDLTSDTERTLAVGRFGPPPFSTAMAWSPDGHWLAWLGVDPQGFTNVHAVSAEGGEVTLLSHLANSFGGSLVWDPKGRSLYFGTGHRTEDGRIARIDLVPRTPVFREDRFRELFEGPSRTTGGGAQDEPAAEQTSDSVTVTVAIELEGIGRRLELLPIDMDVGEIALSPDGKTLVFAAFAEGQQNLYTYSVDEEAEEAPVTRQLTSTPGFKGSLFFRPDGERVFVLDRGRIASLAVSDGSTRSLSVTAELATDFDATKVASFDEAWTYMRDHFYDEALHGADWDAVRARFAPRIAGAASQGEHGRLMNLMLGELNGSHLGYTPPATGDGPSESTGSLGLRFDTRAYEAQGVFRIRSIVPLGPADVVDGVEVGDILLAVDGRELGRGTNLDELLVNRVGKRVVLTLADDPSGERRDVAVQPMNSATERELVYRDWVEGRRSYVDRVSGGRLGYVHMADMSDLALLRLVRDLDAENRGREGVVVDIRNNSGGFVHAYALDIFARRGFLTMESRGAEEVSARTQLGQRSLEMPTVLVVNQNTLSDGEDFTEGYRALGLGSVVGEPTAGWIIYTGSFGLVNGGSMRMPRTKIRSLDGEVMERNPRPVDVLVERPLGESYSGRDSQLDEAVRVLLGALTTSRP